MGLSLRDLGSKVFDQINTMDNGRTFKQRDPTNDRSVIGQMAHNGVTNTAGNLLAKPVWNTGAMVVEPMRSVAAQFTGNKAAENAADARANIAMKGSVPGFFVDNILGLGKSLINTGQSAHYSITGDPQMEKMYSDRAANALNSTVFGQATSPIQRFASNLLAPNNPTAQRYNETSVGLNPDATGAQKWVGDPVMGTIGSLGVIEGALNPRATVNRAVDSKLGLGGIKAIVDDYKLNKARAAQAAIEAGRQQITVQGPRGYSQKVAISESPTVKVDNIRKVINAMPDDKAMKVALFEAKRRLAEQSNGADPALKVRLKDHYEETKANIEQVKKDRVALAAEADKLKQHPAYKEARPLPTGNIAGNVAADSEMLNYPGKPKVGMVETPVPDKSYVEQSMGGKTIAVDKKLPIPEPVKEQVIKDVKAEVGQKFDTSIDPNDPMGNKGIIMKVKNELGSLVDDDHTMISLLKRIEKETGQKGLVDQFLFDAGNVKMSNSIANSNLLNNKGFNDAVGGLSKRQLAELDDYARARAEHSNYTEDMQTNKSRAANAATIAKHDAQYRARYDAMNSYYKDLAGRMRDAHIISEKKYQSYVKNNDYIRLQRDVTDIVSPNTASSSKSRSFATTSDRLKRTGSTREIMSPVRTMMERGQQVELEIQRNIAASNIIDTLESSGLAEKVKDPKNKNTISRFKDGKVEKFLVHGDIKQVVENMSPYQLGFLAKVIGSPVRLFKAGATGLNAPFSLVNYLRDQGTSAVFSKDVFATHAAGNILTSFGSAMMDFAHESKNPLWQDFNKYIGDNTQFSELRNPSSTNAVLREARMGKAGVAINRAISPIRTVEDLISITEKATRFQNFKGIYDKVMKETGDHNEAIKQATLAGRMNTVDFGRSSAFTRTMSLFIPYFNAGVQGSRNVINSLAERPVQTIFKTTAFVGMPMVAATAWNMSDPTRKKAYESIKDFEKKDNYIIVGPNAKQMPDGTWTGIFKIPKPQGYKELADPMRAMTERYMGAQNPESVHTMLQDMLGAFTGPMKLDTAGQALGSITPQAIKPEVQFATGVDLYSGAKTVPDYMNNATDANGNPVAESSKAFKDTSGSMKILGRITGQSPLKVEKAIVDTTGSVGRYVINGMDNALASRGEIPKNEIGGRSIQQDFSRRLLEAKGTLLEENKTDSQKYYESIKNNTKGLTVNETAAWQSLHPQKNNFLGDQIYEANSTYNPAARLDIYNRYPKVFEADKGMDAEARKQGKPGNPLFDLQPDQVKKVLEHDNLPPGSKDPELSTLYNQQWYQDYQAAKSKYFTDVKANVEGELAVSKKAGDTTKTESLTKTLDAFNKTDNPYPTMSPEVQSAMDYYNTLPKGTGARSSWIKANPDAWTAMQNNFVAVDNWQNNQRVKRGLDTTEGQVGADKGYTSATLSSGSSSGSSYKAPLRFTNTQQYTVSTAPKSGIKSVAGMKQKTIRSKVVSLKAPSSGIKKPKVGMKKSKV